MTRHTVRQAAQEAIIGPACGNGPPNQRAAPRDRTGTSGIGTVLRKLHGPVAEEPLPSDLARLLDALDQVDRRRCG